MTNTYTLTVIDVTGIQNYIFGSNRLAENVGASQLVYQATTTWVRDCLPAGRHNLHTDCSIQPGPGLEGQPDLDAEVILSGGGNLLILFRTPTLAREMVGKLTRLLLEQAPGLELAVAHQEFAWTEPIGGDDGVHARLYQKLNQAKQQRQRSAPLLGLGVMLECRSTGWPAVAIAGNPGRPVSAEIRAKLADALQKDADTRLTAMLPAVEQAGYSFRRDFDALGGTANESDYIAVVHADGNGMGQRFKKLVDSYPSADQNRACLLALRQLSAAVDEAGKAAFAATVDRMMQAFQSTAASNELKGFLQGLQRDPQIGSVVLPFRPIVYGGDDVTFVCDGRLGLALARIYLEEWERVTAADATIGPAHACAGVAVVKTHYPFVRAYELSEALCGNAKQAVRKAQTQASALDWHFALSGIGGTLTQIREREYHVADGSLHLRPVALQAGRIGPSWYGWEAFDRVTRSFQQERPWRDQRSKVKQLREVLRDGGDKVAQFRLAVDLSKLPCLDSTRPHLQEKGWDGTQCGYFDAIEALDFYLPLPKEA